MVDIKIRFVDAVAAEMTVNGRDTSVSGNLYELSGVDKAGELWRVSFLCNDPILKEYLEILEKKLNPEC